MTAAAEVLSAKRAEFDTPCRKCGGTIERGRRLALVAGVGAVHVGCLLEPAAQSSPGGDETLPGRPP
jgi:hypothetical protein